MKTIKEGPNKRRGIPCSWFGKFDTDKMSILPKLNYTLNTILIKFSACFLKKLVN